MNESLSSGRTLPTPTEWHLTLACGHEIAVPWAGANPAVLACVVDHRDRCEASEPPLLGLGGWAIPAGRATTVLTL